MKNVFVQTENATNFVTAMSEAEKIESEQTLLCFTSPAGRGKTETARYYAAQKGWTYVLAWPSWTELWMWQDLCFELGIEKDRIPGRKKPCLELIMDVLNTGRRVVVFDEMDQVSEKLLNLLRVLGEKTSAIFAFVGENKLKYTMEHEQRMWSRTSRIIEFKPIPAKDIMFFAKQAAGMVLSANQAELIRVDSRGDFRLVIRTLRHLENLMAVNTTAKLSDDLVKAAIKRGFRGV